MCIKVYIFCFKQKNTHTKTQKKPKKIEKKKKKRLEKMLFLLLTVFVENLTGYDDIVCELLCALLTCVISEQRQNAC